jgi:hypothetical protein
MEEAHVRDVVDVDFCFEDYDKGLAVKFDGEDGRWKE